MNRSFNRVFFLGAFLACSLSHSKPFAQGTVFTYQGSLNADSHPACGSYDVKFALFGNSTNGSPLAGPVTNAAVAVTNGLLVTTVDLGAVFNGSSYWLELAVSTNGANVFTTLAPRQALTPVPYAMFAAAASNLLGMVDASQLTGQVTAALLPANLVTNGASGVSLAGTFTGNGGGLTNLPEALLPPSAWAGAVTTNFNGALEFTNPNNIIASASTPYTQGQFDTPPKGISCWFGGTRACSSETNFANVVSNMVQNGMVANGYNWILMDGGTAAPLACDSPFPLITNGVLYASLTNHQWLDFDPDYFPHGAKWLLDLAHSNGCKVILYAFNSSVGGFANHVGTNILQNVQPGAFGSAYYYGWLSNAIVNWKLDGIKDEVSGLDYPGAVRQQGLVANLTRLTQRPFYVNVATASGYLPWYRGLFSSWRIGVGIIGDANFLPFLYIWLDNAPFWVSASGSFNDFDEYTAKNWYTDPSMLVKNKLAMDAMANAPILLGLLPAVPKQYCLSHGYYYDSYDNPLLNAINNDLSAHLSVLSSNNNVVIYEKPLSDGTHAFAIQNRSFTDTQVATVGFTNFFPSLFPCVVTIHDGFLNAPVDLATNSYTVTLDPNDISWFKVLPGIEQQFAAGSNSLAGFPWSAFYFPYTSDTIGVNNYGGVYFGDFGKLPAPFRGNPAFPTNQTCLQFFPNLTNQFTWVINGNATTFTCNLNGWIGNTDCRFYGDGTLLAAYTCSNNFNQNVSINLTGVNNFQLVMTNAAEAYVYLGDPVVYCPSQTKYDSAGRAWVANAPFPYYAHVTNGIVTFTTTP